MFTYTMCTLKQCTYLTNHQFSPDNPMGSELITSNVTNDCGADGNEGRLQRDVSCCAYINFMNGRIL